MPPRIYRSNRPCLICGDDAGFDKRGRPRILCSSECNKEYRRAKFIGNKLRAGKAPGNTFIKGHEPWNKNLKGIHLSPHSEFKKGAASSRRQDVGAVTYRNDKGRSVRAWVKIAEPNKWKLRAVVVWEQHYGTVPKGCVVHHIDRNTLNDDISNLEVLTRAEHLEEHREEYDRTKATKK